MDKGGRSSPEDSQAAASDTETQILRRAGPPQPLGAECRVRILDDRLSAVVREGTAPLLLYDLAVHAEGPAWQPRHGRLLWSDVVNRRVNAWYPDGRVEVLIDRTRFINGNAVAADGGLFHCEHGRRCISRSDADGGGTEPVAARFEGRRLNAPNDIALGPDGALWFTDPTFGILMPAQGALAEPELDHRSLYRLDPRTGALARMADFEQPNGLAFAPDGRTLYVTDTSYALGETPGGTPGARRDIVAFDIAADATVSNRRTIWRVGVGVPDGLAVDRRGWIWTTAGDGVHILTATGEPLGGFATPDVATNCTFGGADGRRLFVTTNSRLLALDLL